MPGRSDRDGPTPQVSWGRGIEVLTGGLMLFTSDRRFQPLHQTYSVDWGLRILSVRQADAGWYFCQISTSPPKTHYLYLSVVGEQNGLGWGMVREAADVRQLFLDRQLTALTLARLDVREWLTLLRGE